MREQEAGSRAVFVGRVRTNAQIWVNDTNTSWVGHVLQWLVSTYGRTGRQRAETGNKKEAYMLVGVQPNRSAGRLSDDYCQDGIGEVHSCLVRSCKTLLIRIRHCRLQHAEISWKFGIEALATWLPSRFGRKMADDQSFRSESIYTYSFGFRPLIFYNPQQPALASSRPGIAEVYHIPGSLQLIPPPPLPLLLLPPLLLASCARRHATCATFAKPCG